MTAFFGLLSTSLFASPPSLINYQGRLVDGTNLVNSTVGLTLQFYNASVGGTLLYADSNQVAVVDGLYSTFLGDNTTSGNLISALTNAEVWLEVMVNGAALTPRERIVSVGYSLSTRGLLVTPDVSLIGNPSQNSSASTSARAVIGGGEFNQISANASFAVIGGGSANSISANSGGAVIDGGGFNVVGTNASNSTIGGGMQNTIGHNSQSAVIAGGRLNHIRTGVVYGVIGGGYGSLIDSRTEYATIGGGGDNLIGTNSAASTISGGYENRIRENSLAATIGGGVGNQIWTNGQFSTIGGGYVNNIAALAQYATISGGLNNDINANSSHSVIGGGEDNNIAFFTTHVTISGGRGHDVLLNADFSTIGGGDDNNIQTDAEYATIGGGRQNEVRTIAGYGVIGGGQNNIILNSGVYGVVPGGRQNSAASYSFAAGRRAKANHAGSFVWGDSTDADIATTDINQFLVRAQNGLGVNVTNIGSGLSADLGGRARVRGNNPATTPGIWFFDTALQQDRSFVGAGDANHVGFYGDHGGGWGLLMNVQNGRIGLGVFNPDHPLHAASGAHLTAGGTWTSVSDVNRKQNFEPVDGNDILHRVATLPITTWSYTAEPGVKHIGPTAQDFYAAFGVGANDISLSQIDPDGVALAAIQALAKKETEARGLMSEVRESVSVYGVRVSELEAENARLRERLDEIERKLSMGGM